MNFLNRLSWTKELPLKEWHLCVFVIIIGAVLYFQTVFFGLTYADDEVLISKGCGYANNVSNLPQIFRQSVFYPSDIPYYRPILTLTFVLDALIAGSKAYVYHATNVALHLIASCLLLIFLLRLGFKKDPAIFFSVVFTVHPALAQAVAWIPGRNDSLLAIFALASFIFFLRYIKRGKLIDFLANISFLGLALFTKEIAVVLIPIFIVYMHLLKRGKLSAVNKAAFVIAWAGIAVFWFLVRQSALSDTVRVVPSSAARSLLYNLPAIAQFMGKLVMPLNLSVYPTIQDTGFVYGFCALAIVLTALALSKGKRIYMAIFGFTWFTLFLLQSSIQLTPYFFENFQEHRLYVPAIGFILMLMEIDFVKGLSLKKTGSFFICAPVVLILALINFQYCDSFKNNLNFWENAVRTSPHSIAAQYNAGLTHYSVGSLDKSEKEFKAVVSMVPNFLKAHTFLGYVYISKNLPKDAEAEFIESVKSDPSVDTGYLDLALAVYMQARADEAVRLWKRALEINPENTEAARNLKAYRSGKDPDKTVYDREALEKRYIQLPENILSKS